MERKMLDALKGELPDGLLSDDDDDDDGQGELAW